jgi:hypothetical protein
MKPFTLCPVVHVSVLLAPEQITHALQIIFTATAQEEKNDARCPGCPSVDEPTKKHDPIESPLETLKASGQSHGYALFPATSSWTMASVGVV